MGKKNRHNRSSSSASALPSAAVTTTATAAATTRDQQAATAGTSSSTLSDGFFSSRKRLSLLLGIALLTGFFIATGPPKALLADGTEIAEWRLDMGKTIRKNFVYQLLTFQKFPWTPIVNLWKGESEYSDSQHNLMGDPSHPQVFQVLREAIVRETNGYVHPDLGMLMPAPCGAARGLGMVRDSYNDCQRNCTPGVASEKLDPSSKTADSSSSRYKYQQEEVLLRVPLGFQMTRDKALETLKPLFPADILSRKPLEELDDASLLVLLLAHERSKSRSSRWVAYIASLPTEPSCGYWKNWRPYMNDAIRAMSHLDIGWDLSGWPNEMKRAATYADKIAQGLEKDYGGHVGTPKGIPVLENLQWSLCQIASRATAGSERYGALRLVPMLDMINHDAIAGGFVELTGDERIGNGDFVDATEDDKGAFVVRSLRHGRRKPLRKGQELLANYNVPDYTPLDWFVSLGFVPPELWHRWEKLDAALPRVRSDLAFRSVGDVS